MTAELRLPALALPGLSPDSLGNYLASLGLLRVLSRRWPSTRIAWRDDVLQLVGGPTTLDELLDELVRVACQRAWAPYKRGWLTEQMKGTKLGQNKNTVSQAGTPIAEWRARQPEDAVAILDSHIVATTRQMFNPLTGNGGSAGNRDFSDGWKLAVDAIAHAIERLKEADEKHARALAEAKKVRDRAYAKADEKYRTAINKACSAQTDAARQSATRKADDARKKARVKADERHLGAANKADDALGKAERPRDELEKLLLGQPTTWVEKKLNAGSWFSAATKAYNSGQAPARAALISPWAMVLACEGLLFFAGGASRRLGARTRAIGAFPFVTQPVAPEAAGEAGRILGELWAPIWARPMTVAETTTLFSRGRAELRGRGAVTPAAFATAIRERGVDAGVREFRRFSLGRTTSANTFEPRLEARFSLDTGTELASGASSSTLERVTALIEQRGFPRDRKVGQRWRFEGLRGPIEVALLDVAAEPNRSEAGIALLDAVTAGLDRIDRNRNFREGNVRWKPLPLEWLSLLFADEGPGVEARLALSLVSAFPEALPFAAFRFGVEWTRDGKYDWSTKPSWFEHAKVAPARWVWGPGQPARVIGAVLWRRLFDEGKLDATNTRRPQGRGPLPARLSDVSRWLAGEIDESLFVAWISRLALFDWRRISQEVRSLVNAETARPRADGELALLGLTQPLVDRRALVVRSLSPNDLLSDDTGARTAEAARSLVALIRAGKLGAALGLASSRYAMAGARLASFEAPFATHDPDRLVAALLFTISDRDRAVLFECWLRPRRRPQRGEAHA
ncbi:MAG: type I-U CRISPR-associated protein Csx17 [Proteobacteria bacterium]|nr:type I-U CRISPR-associated protein Csx17 [Pseudomonadota bacterium]